jgi:hypothetical protein
MEDSLCFLLYLKDGVNMKFKVLFFAAFILLLVSSAWAGKWTIDSFDDSSEPGDPDNFIAAESSGGLKPVQASQVTPQSGRLYVRQKFEDSFGDDEPTYQIFQGRATEAAAGLGKISLDGIPYATLLKMKLFYSKSAKGDDDLEIVYFDGKDILVEGEDPVYINLNGKMEELKPAVLRDYKISVTSEPSGATVSVGGAEKGKTPVTFNVSSDKTVSVVVSKEGYYTAIKPVTPSGKQATQEGVLLTARKPLNNPATAYKSELQTAVAAKNANAIKTLKTNIQKTLSTYNTDVKKSIEDIVSKFPANPPKASNESSGDYSTRQTLWSNAQTKERDALNKDAQTYFNELKDLLAEVESVAGDFDFALKYEYVPYDAITITKWGVKDLTVNAEIKNSRVRFKYDGAKLSFGSLSKNEIAQDEENIHGVLKIWNTPNEKGKYASIYDIAFFYEETPLKTIAKGTFTLDEATTASKDTEKDLNKRIANYPGKAAWDKKDEAATLETLLKGEIPDGTKVAKPPPPPPKEEVVYDEDEDEEEFEEEMETQTKYDYSRYGAAGNATDIFGNTDEYLFWTGMVFAAAAIGTGVVGFLENTKYAKANDAVKDAETLKKGVIAKIGIACSDAIDVQACISAATGVATNPDAEVPQEFKEVPGLILNINKVIDANSVVRDSYNKSRIIWFSAAGLSAALSIVLFAW